MKYPEFIKPGQTLGICAPSAGVGYKLESFDMSLEVLRDAGFVTAETASVRNDAVPSAPADLRGYEFCSLFADDSVAAVISASGGDYTVEMLPYIDQDLVRANPKWFAGYSDPTAIEMLLTTRLDIATIYGVNAGAWDSQPMHEYQENALRILSGDIPVQHSYEMWAADGFDEEAECYIMDTPVEWTLLRAEDGEFSEKDHLDVSGRLIGGCIDVIDWLIGTPYEDLKGFCDRYKEDGLIWFFDNFELNPMQLMYACNKMKMMGLFDNARAVIFGRTCFTRDADDFDYLEQLERIFAYTDIPVIWNADIGHTKPSFTLINGSMAHLTFHRGDALLSMTLE